MSLGAVDSRQLRIMKTIGALIEGINPTNDYLYDLRGKVFRGRTVFGSEINLPYITILESMRPDEHTRPAGREKIVRLERWELLVQGWANVDRTHPTDALYQLKAAVEHRLTRAWATDQGKPLFPNDYRFGGLATDVEIGPGVVRAATVEPGGAECFYLPVVVTHAINLADPWAVR